MGPWLQLSSGRGGPVIQLSWGAVLSTLPLGQNHKKYRKSCLTQRRFNFERNGSATFFVELGAPVPVVRSIGRQVACTASTSPQTPIFGAVVGTLPLNQGWPDRFLPGPTLGPMSWVPACMCTWVEGTCGVGRTSRPIVALQV